MKTKKPYIISAILIVLVYIGIAWVSDMALNASQKSHFVTSSNSYIKLEKKANEDVLTLLKKDNKLEVTNLNLKKSTPLTDLWNKNIIKKDGSVTKTSNFVNRTFYKAKEYANGKYIILQHTSKRLWFHHMGYFWMLTIIYFLLAIIYSALHSSRKISRQYEINLIADNLKKIGEGKEISPMIVIKRDKLTPLIEQTKKLDKVVNEKSQRAQLLNRRFKSLVGHLPVGVMLLDEAGNVLLHNQSMSVILGKNIDDEIHPFIDDIKTYSLSRMIEHTLRKNQNQHKNIELIGNSGKYVDANVLRIAHSDEDIERQVIVLLYDLTEIKSAEQMQTDFISNVSHELKTPITSINGFAETLLNGAKDNPEDLDKFLNIIHTESLRLSELVQDVLDLSKIDNDDSFDEEVSLTAIIDEVKDCMSKKITEKNLIVDTNVTGRHIVNSSSLLLEEIISNLFNNAVIYNKENGSINLEINHDEIKNILTIIVKDTGKGIADNDIDRLFERFYRVDRVRGKNSEGTGLGLAIVKEAVEKLNGSIKVDSQLGVGTTFTVNIPL